MKKIITLLLLLISACNIVGCAGKTPFEMAKEGPTMKQNYENHTIGDGPDISKGAVIAGVNRELENDLNYKAVGEYAYRRLQNPELKMFIYPHRSTRLGVIVPGYTVSFPMYEKVQYALVGDVFDGQ